MNRHQFHQNSPLERGCERQCVGRGVFLSNFQKTMNLKFKTINQTPLLRGGAKASVQAGVCNSIFKTK